MQYSTIALVQFSQQSLNMQRAKIAELVPLNTNASLTYKVQNTESYAQSSDYTYLVFQCSLLNIHKI